MDNWTDLEKVAGMAFFAALFVALCGYYF